MCNSNLSLGETLFPRLKESQYVNKHFQLPTPITAFDLRRAFNHFFRNLGISSQTLSLIPLPVNEKSSIAEFKRVLSCVLGGLP